VVIIFFTRVRERLLRALKFLLLVLFITVLLQYGIARMGTGNGQFSGAPFISGKAGPAAGQVTAGEEKDGKENFFDELLKRLKGYYQGNADF